MKDIIEETVERIKLEEMAQYKRDLIERLENKFQPLLYHLIYCYLWPTDINLYKWKGEIQEKINSCARLKPDSKFPTEEQLNDWFFDDIKEQITDHLEGYVSTACYREKKNIPEYDVSTLNSFVIDYFNWLCKSISDGKYIDEPTVSKKIDELIQSYNERRS